MSLTDNNSSVRQGHIHEVLTKNFPLEKFPQEDVDTLRFYEGSQIQFSFRTMSELRSFMGEHFQIADVIYPKSYELSERCPVVAAVSRN